MTDQPLLRVVRGEPTPEELAAVVVALTARSAAPVAPRLRSVWADRAAGLRVPLHPGRNAWLASARRTH